MKRETKTLLTLVSTRHSHSRVLCGTGVMAIVFVLLETWWTLIVWVDRGRCHNVRGWAAVVASGAKAAAAHAYLHYYFNAEYYKDYGLKSMDVSISYWVSTVYPIY